MFVLIKVGVVLAAALAYVTARRFVGDRLRFVDAVQRRRAPWIAGLGAGLIALPVAWLLPFVGAGSALLFGLAVGTGVAHGGRDIRRISGSVGDV